MSSWKSLHVFYHDILYKELLLCNVITPYLTELMNNKKIEKWFFINYWEGGPHIRVRVQGIEETDYENLKNIIKEYINLNNSRIVFSKEEYYKGHKFDGKKIDYYSLPWYEDGSIVEIVYEPEHERYGGINVIDLAENVFSISSQISSIIIKNTINNFNLRFGIGVDLFIKVLHDIDCFNVYFVNLYSSWWGQYLGIDKTKIKSEIYDVIVNKIELITSKGYKNNIVEYFSSSIKAYFEDLKKNGIKENIACSIIASQIHMMNNRLAITPEYEFIMAEAILNRLEKNKIMR